MKGEPEEIGQLIRKICENPKEVEKKWEELPEKEKNLICEFFLSLFKKWKKV